MKKIYLITIFIIVLMSCTKPEQDCWVCKTESPDIPWFGKLEMVIKEYCNISIEKILEIEKEGTCISEIEIPKKCPKGDCSESKPPTIKYHIFTKCNLR
jgi:hypothetical protein